MSIKVENFSGRPANPEKGTLYAYEHASLNKKSPGRVAIIPSSEMVVCNWKQQVRDQEGNIFNVRSMLFIADSIVGTIKIHQEPYFDGGTARYPVVSPDTEIPSTLIPSYFGSLVFLPNVTEDQPDTHTQQFEWPITNN